MRKSKLLISALVLSMSIFLSACGSKTTETEVPVPQKEIALPEEQIVEEPIEDEPEEISDESQEASQISEPNFSIADIAPYTGEPYVIVNDNVPYFSDADLTNQSYEFYSDLDDLGRCGVAHASIGLDLMPTEKRGDIGQVKPSGWYTVKYDNVDGKYLYNRCHLIGYQLSGENANEKNLITGTRYMNVDGMLPFENMVADYVKETENHVLYRVTPVFEGDNLLASGVLMEAESVEDKGEDIFFCVFVYNVQPGITIDYVTGESSLDENVQDEENEVEETPEPESNLESENNNDTGQAISPEQNVSIDPEPQGTNYILNTNTKKFHYPTCSSVGQMKESNKEYFTGSRDDVISRGYVPCKRCNP